MLRLSGACPRGRQSRAAASDAFPGFGDAIVPEHFYPESPLTYGAFPQRYLGMAGNQPLALS